MPRSAVWNSVNANLVPVADMPSTFQVLSDNNNSFLPIPFGPSAAALSYHPNLSERPSSLYAISSGCVDLVQHARYILAFSKVNFQCSLFAVDNTFFCARSEEDSDASSGFLDNSAPMTIIDFM